MTLYSGSTQYKVFNVQYKVHSSQYRMHCAVSSTQASTMYADKVILGSGFFFSLTILLLFFLVNLRTMIYIPYLALTLRRTSLLCRRSTLMVQSPNTRFTMKINTQHFNGFLTLYKQNYKTSRFQSLADPVQDFTDQRSRVCTELRRLGLIRGRQ